MVTLRDVAARCGVSVSTVSRALNGIREISPERAEEIRRLAREMGYRPDAAARALKTNRSSMIGVLYEAPLTHPFFSIVLDAMRSEAEKKGFDLLFLSRVREDGRIVYPDRALSRKMDGIVVFYADLDASGVRQLLQGQIPVVSLDDSGLSCDAVMTDYRKSSLEIINAAWSLGHRRIAFAHGQIGFATRERLAGYRAALSALGIPLREEYTPMIRFNDAQGAAEAIERLLALPDPPTCILLPDDVSALGALRILEKKGLRAPRDFSCMGFDGIPQIGQVSPELSSYRQDAAALGEALIDQLHSALSSGIRHPAVQRVIPGSLIPGETLAAPRRP